MNMIIIERAIQGAESTQWEETKDGASMHVYLKQYTEVYDSNNTAIPWLMNY